MIRQGQEEIYALLPVYLVLDSSASMSGEPFRAALSFVPELLSVMDNYPVIRDKVRLEIITFDESARVAAPLSDKENLIEWYNSNQHMQAEGISTNYTNVFKLLKKQIGRGVEAVTSEKVNDTFYKTYRPAVFFITDGDPNCDNESSIEQAFNELTSENFIDHKGRNIRPNIFVVGVGKATKEKLEKYGAGRYKRSEYTAPNANAVLVKTIRDGVAFTPEKVLKSIIPKLVASIIYSTNNAKNSSDLEDPLGDAENIFGEDGFDFDFDNFGLDS